MSRRVVDDRREWASPVRDQARWEHELRRVQLREAFIGWLIASGIGLVLVGIVALVVLGMNGAL